LNAMRIHVYMIAKNRHNLPEALQLINPPGNPLQPELELYPQLLNRGAP